MCLPSARVTALVLGGVQGKWSSRVSLPGAGRGVGGRWEPRGWEGVAVCLPVPFNWSSWALNPHSEEVHTLPMCFIHHSEFWGLLADFVLHACPQRGVLGRGFESPCSLLPNRERKQYRVFLPLAGLESMVGQEAFSALHWEPSSALGGCGVGWGVQLCLVHLFPQQWAGPAPCSREGAHPSPLITVTKERRSAGMEETRGWHVPSNPHPHGTYDHGSRFPSLSWFYQSLILKAGASCALHQVARGRRRLV